MEEMEHCISHMFSNVAKARYVSKCLFASFCIQFIKCRDFMRINVSPAPSVCVVFKVKFVNNKGAGFR